MKVTDKKKAALIALGVAVFVLQLALNFLTPYLADDYPYMRNLAEMPGETLLERVVNYRLRDYFSWDGRVVGHSFSSLLLGLDNKPLFNVINAVMYAAMTMLIYLLAKPKGDGARPALYASGAVLLWFFTPELGQTTLWLTGSCNYLWGMVFILAFLLPFKRLADSDYQDKASGIAAVLKCAGMLLLGIISGWYMENSSAAAVFFVICFIIYGLYNKKKLPAWCWCALAGSVAGLAGLVLSPGSGARAAGFTRYSPLITLASRIAFAVEHLVPLAVPLAVFGALFAVKYIKKERKSLLIPALFFLAAMAANFSMIAAPTYPDRSVFPVSVYTVSALLSAAAQFKLESAYRPAARIIGGFLAVITLVDFSFAAMDIMCAAEIERSRQTEGASSPYAESRIVPMTDHSPFTLDGGDGPPAYNNWGAVMAILTDS